ncbi:MAG TPA: hypothetical protein VKI65_06640 [Gemmataceae bacterium]|nr:hypothetical protein [Gemmataceae bacterium]
MHLQFVMSQHTALPAVPATTAGADTADLLRQLLEVQREQLALQKTTAAAHDMTARWRAFLARWHEDFPQLAESCKSVLPMLERSFGELVGDLADYLRDSDNAALGNEFTLGEFLDRYGMRVSQLGGILGLVGLIAEAATPRGDSA